MRKRLVVLLLSAGRRVQLMNCLRQSAVELGIELTVLAADHTPHLSAACHLADRHFVVPGVRTPEYVPAVQDLCRTEGVRLVIPTIDPELAPLSAAHQDLLDLGTFALVSSPAVVNTAGNKLLTAQALAGAGVETPSSLLLRDYLRDPSALKGAVVAKPLSGSSSVGLIYPSSVADLDLLDADTYLIQQRLEGTEYTVTLYVDKVGEMRCAIAHERIEVRGGEVSKGRTKRLACLSRAAAGVAAALPGIRGPVCFQAMVDPAGHHAHVFEINARFGGGYPLAHRAGAHMTRWALEEVLDIPCTAHDNWAEDLTMLRYDDAVFVNG